MINCPTCGHPVADNQRFCGNCGTDVQAAAGFHAPAQASTGGAAIVTPQVGAYGYDQGGYDYQPTLSQRPAAMIWLIIAGVAVVCLCCRLLLGALISYFFFPTQSVPPAAPIPTPQGVNLIIALLRI